MALTSYRGRDLARPLEKKLYPFEGIIAGSLETWGSHCWDGLRAINVSFASELSLLRMAGKLVFGRISG